MAHVLVVVLVVLVVTLLWAASPIVTIAFLAWAIFATLGYVIGVPKGHGVAGIVLGILGPIGLLIVARLRPRPTIRYEGWAAEWDASSGSAARPERVGNR